MTTLIDEVTIKAARKEHRCNWCQEAIEVGTSYVRQRLVDGSDAWVFRAHPECDAAFSSLDRIDQETACTYGETYTRGCTCERGDTLCDRTPRCAGSKDGAT